MNINERIDKAIYSLERAKNEYNNGEKRISVASLDHAYNKIDSCRWIIKAQIEEDQNKINKINS